MKKILMIPAVLFLSFLAFTPSARADWGFQIGMGLGHGQISGGYYHGSRHVRPVYPVHHRPVHVHVRIPVYASVWVPPVYGQAIVGYTTWGYPMYGRVVVHAGYHRRVITGYHCSSCGSVCY